MGWKTNAYGVGIFEDYFPSTDNPSDYPHKQFGLIDLKWAQQQDGNWGKVDQAVDASDGFEYWVQLIAGKTTDASLGQVRADGDTCKVFLKVVLRGNTHDADEGSYIPSWVYQAPYNVTKLTLARDGYTYTYPNYSEAGFLDALHAMIDDFAADYDGDARIEGIMVALGEDGESKPYNTAKASWVDSNTGNTWQTVFTNAGVTAAAWVTYVAAACALFTSHFLTTPVFFVPGWHSGGNSAHMRNVAEAALNAGCHMAATYWEDELDPPYYANSSPAFSSYTARLSWIKDYCEASVGLAANRRLYIEMGGSDSQSSARVAYWQMLYGLSLGADYFGAYRTQSQAAGMQAKWSYFTQYAGVEIADTPGAWIAFRRETQSLSQPQKYMRVQYDGSDATEQVTDVDAVDFPDTKIALDYWMQADYQRWITLYDPQNTTVGLWNVGDSSYPEGAFARRTDYASSKRTLYLLIDDAYVASSGAARFDTTAAGLGARIRTVYYDQGTGSFQVRYDNASGVNGALAGTVTKTNTLTWISVTHTVSDAKFAGGLTNSADVMLTVPAGVDEDTTFHLVEVQMTGGDPEPPEPVVVTPATPRPSTGRPIDRWREVA